MRGSFDPPVFVLWFALTVWIAGFDLVYACQDVAFDRAAGLHSIPARFGIKPALDLAKLCHLLTVAAFALLGWVMGLGILYWVGVLVVAALLVYEHSLVSPVDLSRLDVAFFNVNGYIAVILLAAVLAGRYVYEDRMLSRARHARAHPASATAPTRRASSAPCSRASPGATT